VRIMYKLRWGLLCNFGLILFFSVMLTFWGLGASSGVLSALAARGQKCTVAVQLSVVGDLQLESSEDSLLLVALELLSRRLSAILEPLYQGLQHISTESTLLNQCRSANAGSPPHVSVTRRLD
jgi:hypothetical protein